MAEPPQDGNLPVVLLPAADHVLELFPPLVGTAEAARRVGQGADGQNRGLPERGLLEGEVERVTRGRGSVRSYHDGAGDKAGRRPPVPAHHHHPAAGVGGHLRADRAQAQPGDSAEASGAEHHHGGVMAALADSRRGGARDEQRADFARSH